MFFDPFIYQGMADMQDRHRDMRLDVDNMSYEVQKGKFFSIHNFTRNCFLLIVRIRMSGTAGIGRTHRRCEHWTKWRHHFEVNETAKIHYYYCSRICTGLGTLLYLSGCSYVHIYGVCYFCLHFFFPLFKRWGGGEWGAIFFPPLFSEVDCYFLLLNLSVLNLSLSRQEEYADGDELGGLDCGHDFHTSCIKQWLMQKNLCPICKTTALLKWKEDHHCLSPEIISLQTDQQTP